MKYAVSILLVLVLALAGCSSDQTINALDLTVDAVSAALPLLAPSAGIPAALTSQLQGYLGATSTAIASASDILAGPGTDGEKAAQIAASFAGIAAPSVPAQYQGIANAVQQVALMVAKFLADLPPASPAAAVAKPAGSSSFLAPAPKSKTTKFSAAQKKKLAEIKAKAQAAASALKR